MEETDENSPAVDHDRLMRMAEEELVNRRIAASDQFKSSLLVASNAIQATRMLENLKIVLTGKKERGEETGDIERQVEEADALFREAIHEYDDDKIFDVAGRVEQLTLSHDPFYLEGEEVRKKEFFENKRKVGVRRATWATSPSSRFVSLMRGDLEGKEEVTEEEQRSCISRCAWGFAILGMVVAISFLIADFWSAQVSPTISTNLVRNDDLVLPVIYACLSLPNIPIFEDLPNERYKGLSLWGLRSYENLESGEIMMFPETKSIAEPSFLGNLDHCPTVSRKLSAEALKHALGFEPDLSKRCHSCLRIGRKVPFRLNREAALVRPRGAVTLEFASSRLLELCFNPGQGSNEVVKNGLRDVLKAQGEDLEKKKIVEIIGAPSLSFALNYGFDDFKNGNTELRNDGLGKELSVLCNLYFFSGHFFPVESGKETKYIYDLNGGVNSWKEVGNTSNFFRSVSDSKLVSDVDVSREAILKSMTQESREEAFVIADAGIQIFKVDDPSSSPGAYKDFVRSLRRNHRDTLSFTKKIDNGVSTYATSFHYGEQKIFKAVGLHRRYNISLDYKTFDTEVITRRPATSTAEFLTDVFEYVGLFTGICAYSVLVGPARMYLKRKPTQPNAQ